MYRTTKANMVWNQDQIKKHAEEWYRRVSGKEERQVNWLMFVAKSLSF